MVCLKLLVNIKKQTFTNLIFLRTATEITDQKKNNLFDGQGRLSTSQHEMVARQLTLVMNSLLLYLTYLLLSCLSLPRSGLGNLTMGFLGF